MDSSFLPNLKRGFGLSLAILLISSVGSFLSIRSLSNRAERVNHTNVVLQQSEKIASLLKDAETGQRGFLLTGNDLFLTPFKRSRENIFSSIDSLTVLTSDNKRQQINCVQLRMLIRERFNKLDQLIQLQILRKGIDTAELLKGQQIMDQSKQLIQSIQNEEKKLLAIRTNAFLQFSIFTPFMIILTSLFALVITFYFFQKIKRDYEKRLALQQTLERSEIQMVNRIQMIEDIASQISEGNYKVRVPADESDDLGKLSVALNKMATGLDAAFQDFTNREWLKNGLANVNEKMIGEKDIATLSKNILSSLAGYTNSQAAALYLFETDVLRFAAGYALTATDTNKTINLGEGLVGQCAENRKMMVLNQMPHHDIVVSYASGQLKPNNLVVFPLLWENELKGVIELAALSEYNHTVIEFLQQISHSIALSIESAWQHERLYQLLNETQAQTEELQVQQHELEQLNAELENHTQRLQGIGRRTKSATGRTDASQPGTGRT